jgi:hypothetical protein
MDLKVFKSIGIPEQFGCKRSNYKFFIYFDIKWRGGVAPL